MQHFTPYFDTLAPEVGQVPTLVFGVIWRFCQMTDNVCKATLQTLADRLAVNRMTIIRAIQVLTTADLIKDLTPDLRNRPHVYRLTPKAQRLVSAYAVSESDTQPAVSVTESDSTGNIETPGVTESDRECNAELQPAVTESDLNQTLLLNKLRDKSTDNNSEEFYRSKVNYINSQQLAFLNIRPIMYCDFHSFDGKVFKISHPDPYFVARLNATFREIYYKLLRLWIDIPDFKVGFVTREISVL